MERKARNDGDEGRLRSGLVGLLLGACLAPGPLLAALTIETGFFPTCKPAAPGEAGPRGFTCQDLFVAGFDGTLLDATLYVPDGASPAAPVPAILMTHGGSGWHRQADQPYAGDVASQRKLAAQGYVVLAWTSRGHGRSEGDADDALSRDHGVRDAQTLVTWLADAANTGGTVLLDAPDDPRIGMFGGSSAGAIQLLVASRDRRIDAITPQATWNDLLFSFAPNGVIKSGWGALAGVVFPTHSNHLSAFEYFDGRILPPVASTRTSPTGAAHTLASFVTNDSVELPVTRTDGSRTNAEWLRRRSPIFENAIDDLRAPTLLIQGQRDTLFWLNEAIASARVIARNGVPTKVVLYGGGHVWSDLADERDAIDDRILRWFDRHLRGNPAADTGAPVEVWQPWIEGVSSFAGLSDFPAAETDAGLSPEAAVLVNVPAPTSHTGIPVFQESLGFAAPAADFGWGVTGVDFPASVPAGTILAGIPTLRFTVTASAVEAIVFAKVWDEHPSGRRTLIHGHVTPARIRGGHGDFCSQATASPFSPTLVGAVEVCLPLAGIVWRIESGHRLVLTLATSDSMYFGSRHPGIYEITNLSLELPVVKP